MFFILFWNSDRYEVVRGAFETFDLAEEQRAKIYPSIKSFVVEKK